MLTLYIRDYDEPIEDVVPSGSSIVFDVEAAFSSLVFPINESNQRIVKLIDGGVLVDRRHFQDRFGTQIYTDCLSTGCKAALIVNNSESIVSLHECGLNARDATISCCKHGNAVMVDPGITFCSIPGIDEIEVSVYGKVFHTVDDLNDYIFTGCLAD